MPPSPNILKGSDRLILFGARFGTLIALLAMILTFAALLPPFRTQLNWINLAGQTAVVGIFAIALTCSLKMGDFDFSIGATASLSGVLLAKLLVGGMDLPLAAALGLLAGVVIGLINGTLVGYLKLDSFICTIATALLILGCCMGITKGQSITSGLPAAFEVIGRGRMAGIPVRFLIFVGIALPVWIIHAYTETGRRMEAVAGNVEAARLYGINVPRSRMLAFLMSGACSAVAGIVMTSSVMSARPTDNLQYLLGALAACFIGASTVRIGQFHVWGTFVGVLIKVIATNGLILLMVPGYVTKIAEGLILLTAILITIVSARYVKGLGG
jgi:ribose transport system permease protein